MPFTIARNDITEMKVDIIVNSTDYDATKVGGADAAIYNKAGHQLINARKELGKIKTSEVKYTEGYLLNSNYVYHIAGPAWKMGTTIEKELLYSCYMNALNLAKEMKQASIAFPLISSGALGFPKSIALEIATKAFQVFLLDNEMDIYLVIYDDDSYLISKQLYHDIDSYINANIIRYKKDRRNADIFLDSDLEIKTCNKLFASLEEDLDSIDGTFQETLFKLIDDRGYKDSYVYKKANMDRRLFAKIRKDKFYHPSKNTVLSLCIALELNVIQTKDLLSRAGYDLSMSIPFDVIVHYFIKNSNFNIYEINEALFSFDQELLGYMKHYDL